MKNRDNLDHLVILTLGLVALASGLDLRADLEHGAGISHLIKEAVIMLLAAGVGLWLLLRLRRQQHEIRALQQALIDSRRHADQAQEYVRQAREQLALVVRRQFEEWGLSESEQAVGWLILKGFSLKEIALLRETREKTVRQQASSIYHKTGLPGRHAFSGWFFEDLLAASLDEKGDNP